jgi:hypothetical protein
MAEPIFLKHNDGKLVKLDETLYEKEKDLQKILADNPELIYSISDQIPPLLLVAKEAGIPGEEGSGDDFSLDHIFVDIEAKPTFIEVKRSTDTRIRREVIGQMFDYAAHARAYWTSDKIQTMFRDTWIEREQDPEITLRAFIGEDKDPVMFWEQFMTNLKGGNVRLIFAADTIPKRLQLIVEFLRDYMDPIEVRALEVRQFLGENELQMIAPHFVGGSVKADIRKQIPGSPIKLNEELLYAVLEKKTVGLKAVANKILSWAQARGMQIWWGRYVEGSYASVIPMIQHKGKNHQLFGIWSYGKIEIQFKYMKNYAAFTSEEKRLELLALINRIPGANIPKDGISRLPPLSLELLKNDAAFSEFTNAMEWAEREIRQS